MVKIFDLILASFLGIILGTITGLLPGIHVNTVGAFTFATTPILLNSFSPECIAVFLLSMSISHALLEFIPSILLGVPEESTALSILPGHRMVLEGRAKEAIRLAAMGGLGGVILTILFLPFFLVFLPSLYAFMKPYIGIFLLLMSAYLIVSLSRDLETIVWSLILFLLSGVMGWVILNTPLSPNMSLLCTFSGLFGVSTLIYSLSKGSILPEQDEVMKIKIRGKILRGIFAGGIAGTLLGFLPGFGPAQGSIIAQELSGGNEDSGVETFLTSLSSLNTSDALFSLMAIYLIGNPRSGVAVYISKIIQNFSLNHLLFFSFTSLLAVGISFILCIKIGDILSTHMKEVDYQKLSKFVIASVTLIIIIFSLLEKAPLHFILVAYVTSIAFGMLPHYLGVSKSHLMGVLIIPALFIYL